MNKYLVTATLKFPSCFDRGYEFSIIAANAKDAVKKARREVFDAGHTRQDGPIAYRAVKES